ncbi:MAG TPA: SH3 domain-containing C40 family peptidase, partial [Armatimonadota bacterium]|nr:SH3 domain-containing C40 family peptidase [Armatimonadota bacterium]
TGFRPVDTLSQPAASSAPRDPTTITATQVRVAATALSGDGLVQEGLVNVRAGPGMGFNLIGQATRGTPLRVIGATNGWFLVRFASGAEGWVAGWLVATDQSIAQQISPAQTPAGQPTSLGNSIAQYALGFVGTPYVFGGSSPSGFDCSGLVQYVLKHHNIRVPRTSFEQWDVGTPVDPSRLIPGDLVFFANTYTAGVSHVGIYVGNGNFVHASRSGVGVIVQPLKERAGSYCGARRVY